MKIACLLENESYGGSVQMLLWVSNSLALRGHDVTVITICSSETVRELAPNCSFVDLGQNNRQKNKRSLGKSFKLLPLLKKTIKELNPDVVINFGDHAFYYGLILRKKCNYRYVVSERIDPYTNRSKNDIIRRRLYNLCDGAIFQTEKAKKFFSARLQKKAAVIPNPVKRATNNEWRIEMSNEAVCFFGRLDNFQKRVDILIHSFSEVHKIIPNYRLDIWGSGTDTETSRLKDLVSSLNLENVVFFRGVSKNVLTDMLHYRMLVFTSDYEGIPNVIIEAMTIGIPIVATDCSPGGAALLLNNGEYGKLVECGNTSGIASAIIELINNTGLSIELGQNAMKSLERFNEDVIANRWEHYLLSIGESNE